MMVYSIKFNRKYENFLPPVKNGIILILFDIFDEWHG